MLVQLAKPGCSDPRMMGLNIGLALELWLEFQFLTNELTNEARFT